MAATLADMAVQPLRPVALESHVDDTGHSLGSWHNLAKPILPMPGCIQAMRLVSLKPCFCLEKAKVTQKERPIIGFIDTHGTEATMAGHTKIDPDGSPRCGTMLITAMVQPQAL